MQQPPMSLAGMRRLLASPLPQAAPVWAARPRLLTSLRAFSIFRTPATTSVVVRGQRQGQRGRPSAAAAAAALSDGPPAASSFADLGISPGLQSAMAEYKLTEPTEIQVAAFREVMRGGDLLLASHTGSGKTLAYLLPLVTALKQEEAAGAAARPGRPRALVLGPTRELADQLLRVAKSLAHHEKFRSACVSGGGGMEMQTRALRQPVDLLVGTPQRILQHAAKGNLAFGDVRWVVLDEADTMFDSGFGGDVRELLKRVRRKTPPASCLLVAATVTQAIKRLLADELPDMRRVETASLHRGIAGSRHSFHPLPQGADKLTLLLQTVEGEARRGARLMVFCNTLDSCRATEHHLSEAGLPTLSYHGDVPLDGRREAIAKFASEAAAADEQQPILVCTDLAARGLDMPGRVDHVVNFDFPLNPVDYLHRTGRTARAGAPGRITSLVTRRDQVLASRIEDALNRNLPLDGLSSDKKELPPHMRPKPETLKRRENERNAERSERRGLRGASRVRGAKGKPRGPLAAAGRKGGGGGGVKLGAGRGTSAGRGGGGASSAGRGGRGGGKLGAGRGTSFGGRGGGKPSARKSRFSKFK